MPEVRFDDLHRGGWTRVSQARPCTVCESPDWCTFRPGVACCMRVKSNRPLKNGGFMHLTTDSREVTKRIERPKEKRVTDAELDARFALPCLEWRGCEKKIVELAGLLGVSVVALDRLGVGWDGSAWTFPERNHVDKTVGVNRRFADGNKLCLLGSRRGLTYATDWFKTLGPIFIVEGGSDVAAGLTLGLCVVGRSSNMGGVEYLVRLLSRHDRRVVLLAECDAKGILPPSHDPSCRCCGQCWPGKFGAIETAKRLSKRLGKLIDWSFLPDGAKDLRAWLNSKGANPDNESAMRRIRASLIGRTRNAIH